MEGIADGEDIGAGAPTPVCVRHLRLSPALLRWLQQEPALSGAEADLPAAGFQHNDDSKNAMESRAGVTGAGRLAGYTEGGRASAGHQYWEAYWHTLAHPGAEWSMNPRDGADFAKPAAPARLRAFAAAFRRANDAWLRGAAAAAAEAAGGAAAPPFRPDLAFADVAVQVHYGDAVPAATMRWHTDVPNSILHMAVSIRGERVVHSRIGGRQHRARQVPGDVYVSAPVAYWHAVEYPAAEWGGRVVALQLRVLMRRAGCFAATGYSLTTRRMSPPAAAAVAAVSRALAAAAVRVPTLEEVRAEEGEIARTPAPLPRL